jgi:plasmid segregation protein ParM
MTNTIMGIDAGNYETKVCTVNGANSFLSDIGEYRERKLDDSFGKDDIVWEYKGEKGFGGTLARFESEFGGTIKGKSKAHPEALLRILIAIHKHGGTNNNIIVGQPIESHDVNEKNKLKELIKGEHTIIVNGQTKTFKVDNVEVAPEGPSAILASPVQGLVRLIDIGSGTTNFATLMNLKRIDKDSWTEQIGTEIMRNKDPKEMAKKIKRIISGTWNIFDEIYLTGGGAHAVHSHLTDLFPNCKILKPKMVNGMLHTKYGNVVGFYNIANGLWNQ